MIEHHLTPKVPKVLRSETKTFYNFLMNSICDIEILYFMKGEETPYHNEVISLVMEFQEKLKKYESDFVG
jgi:hypothetical protein